MNLVKMTGAAVFVTYDSGQKPNFSLAGGRTQSQMFWIDGGAGQNMRLSIGQVDVDPPVDTVKEVKILSNSYPAEYGGSAGGVIIATTKSGTNDFRGSALEYFRHDVLDAANFFAPVVEGRKQKAPLRYNVFGGTLGGPIRRDRTFFFFSYEGSRRRTGITRVLTVPTDLQRRGDFSQTFDGRGSLIAIYDPSTTAGTSRTPFAGNVIPQSRLDPVALKLMALYPMPNRAPDNVSGANNFAANSTETLERDNYMVKVDHTLGPNEKVSARYLYNSDNRFQSSVLAEPAADTVNDALRHQNYFYVGYTRTFGRAIVNERRYTYGNRINHEQSPGLGGAGRPRLDCAAYPTRPSRGLQSPALRRSARPPMSAGSFRFSSISSSIRSRTCADGTRSRPGSRSGRRSTSRSIDPLSRGTSASRRSRRHSPAGQVPDTASRASSSAFRTACRSAKRKCSIDRAGIWPPSSRTTGPSRPTSRSI